MRGIIIHRGCGFCWAVSAGYRTTLLFIGMFGLYGFGVFGGMVLRSQDLRSTTR
jgi:hypothetical protein